MCALVLARLDVLTHLGGEADPTPLLTWLVTLAGLSVVWLVALGSNPPSPLWLMGIALGIRVIFLNMPPVFSRTARSMEFLPVILDYLRRQGRGGTLRSQLPGSD